jgi:hypothetical protein
MIKTVEQMEAIVNKFNELSWNGWDVIELKKSPSAMMHVHGAYIDGTWYIKNIFSPSENGWKLPSKYLG